jgi:hypothetical protein
MSVAKGRTCSYFWPTWKPSFHAIITKMLQTASWVLMHSLPKAQHRRWIPIRSIGCVQTHRGSL